MSDNIISVLARAAQHRLRAEITDSVRSLFNDQEHGERPVTRSTEGLFQPSSAIWRVHGDVTSMMVGGVSALLLQMLHPAVLAGVWDHSNFRTDMIGRLRRTARFVALTTYGSKFDASDAIDRVKHVHEQVGGHLPDGTSYKANDPALLAWVHVAEATSFLKAWQRFGNRALTRDEIDQYFADFARVAEALGADPVPRSASDAEALIVAMRPQLAVTARTKEVAGIVLNQQPANPLALPVRDMTFRAAIALLPRWAQRMHGFAEHPLTTVLTDAGTSGLARTLRWAFAQG